jgi:glutamate/tyrosine decarboxylase-like PLP-dependent enzyme
METITPAEPVTDFAAALDRVHALSRGFLAGLGERPVGPRLSYAELVAALGGPLPDKGAPPVAVVDELAAKVERGLVASAGPRYFGFVIGGSLPAALGADWLTSAWDQNAGMTSTSPAANAVEAVVAEWLKDLAGLPAGAEVGFVTGCQMANFTGLVAARHSVLARAGWDVEEDGLQGAPRVHLVVGAEAHATIFSALRMLGLGTRHVVKVEADDQGRMRPEALRAVLARLDGPTIVCAQAGNVNTGAFDPLDQVADATSARGAWLHVDGAFGLWAAAAPARRHLVRGIERADSWATDGHKWLNVPYDSGIAIVREQGVLGRALRKSAAYLVRTDGARDGADYTPEASRRARGFALWAGLRSLGREGVAAMIEGCCRHATRLAEALRAGGVTLLNDVVLNQVLVRFEPRVSPKDGDALTRAVAARVQKDGVCWASGTRWRDRDALRLSASNWSTRAEDVDRTARAILDAYAAEDR